MKIAILGAGAVGCYFGGLLARAGHEVTLIGRPAHVDAVRANGLRLQTTSFDVQVPLLADTDPQAVAGAQIVLFCVKSTDTESAGLQMREHLAPDALVLSLQNGVDNAERLQALLPAHTVLPAVVYVATEMAGPGHVRHHGRGELIIGPSTPSARSEAAARLFTEAGAPTQVFDNVLGALWAKLLINCAYNALSAITRRPYGEIYPSTGMLATMRAAADECVAVARADGIEIPGDPYAAIDGIFQAMPAQYSSTAQDLMRGKPSEIDHINGYVLRRAEARGLDAPINRALHALVKLIEAGAQDPARR